MKAPLDASELFMAWFGFVVSIISIVNMPMIGVLCLKLQRTKMGELAYSAIPRWALAFWYASWAFGSVSSVLTAYERGLKLRGIDAVPVFLQIASIIFNLLFIGMIAVSGITIVNAVSRYKAQHK